MGREEKARRCGGSEPHQTTRVDEKQRSIFFFFKQKTPYEISECDWSSDVCSSDLTVIQAHQHCVGIDNLLAGEVDQCGSGPETVGSEERRVGKECRIGCRSRWS